MSDALIPIDQRTSPRLFKTTEKPTIKMRLWLKEYLKCGNATKAVQKVYKVGYNSAKTMASDNLSKLNYQEFMEEAGITDKYLMTKVKQGLNSKRLFSSHTEPDKMVADMPTRHKYLETALKLKRRLSDAPIINSDKTLILDVVSVTKTKSEPLQGTTGVDEK